MPIPAYIKITGEKQGLITAKCGIQRGHEDEVLVQAFSHEVLTPVDVQSGQPTGQRMHKPVVITKVFDKSSPLLYNALCTGERMKEVEITWWQVTGAKQEHYFTHKLEDAIIVHIKASMPNCQDPAMAHFTHLEEVYFTYRKISWEHVVGKTSALDDWNART